MITTYYDPDTNSVWYRYTVHFEHMGDTFSFHVMATSEKDANARLESIRNTARIEGWVVHEEEV